MERDKKFVFYGSLFVVILSLIYLFWSNGESSFLDASGDRDAAKQKLMVVDQTTGEISFVNKSLAGINKNFTDEDVSIKGDIEDLRRWNLDRIAEIQTLQNHMKTSDRKGSSRKIKNTKKYKHRLR